MPFSDALRALYIDRPCRVLPNALWKTLAEVERCKSRVVIEHGRVVALELWDAHRLLVTWTASMQPTETVRAQLRRADLALVHHAMFHG